jgi:hypothetical protein
MIQHEEDDWMHFFEISNKVKKGKPVGWVGKGICDNCGCDYKECFAFKIKLQTIRICKSCCSDMCLDVDEE